VVTGLGKPVVASIVGADGRLPDRESGVPNFRFPEACAHGLALAAERREWLSRPLGQPPALDGIDEEAARGRVAALPDGWLGLEHVIALLGDYGIRVMDTRRCASADEAVEAAARVARPVVLKADFPPPAVAEDVYAVLLGLEGEEALRAGWEALRDRVERAGRTWQGAIVQPFADPGADVLVGALNHPQLGVVAGVGPGGRQVGLGEVAFRLAPATDVDADEMVTASPGVHALVEGRRGGPTLDRLALAEVVLRLARLFEPVPELAEADLNPVRVLREGAVVLDARLRLERRAVPARLKTW